MVADSRAKGKNVHASTKSPSETDSSDEPVPITIKKEKLDDVHVLTDDDEGFLRDQFKQKGKAKVIEAIRNIKKEDRSSGGGSKSGSGKKRDSYSAMMTHSITEIAANSKKRALLAQQRIDLAHQTQSISSPVKNREVEEKINEGLMMDECMDVLNKLSSERIIDDICYTKGIQVLTDPLKVRLLSRVPHEKWALVIESFFSCKMTSMCVLGHFVKISVMLWFSLDN